MAEYNGDYIICGKLGGIFSFNAEETAIDVKQKRKKSL
jgi:hypothetical protein